LVTMNYYNTLGLSPDSSAEEIKKVYRKLAMQYHPDRNGGNPEGNYMFYEEGVDDDFISVLRKFSQMSFNAKRTGGCRRKGLGKGMCGRWKR